MPKGSDFSSKSLGTKIGILTGLFAPIAIPVFAGIGAATGGLLADKFTNLLEKKMLEWGGLPEQ